MKKLFNKIANTANNAAISVKTKANNAVSSFMDFNRRAMTGNAGEGYIDTAVKILIAVVLGALLLGLLYALFKDTIMPTVTQKINEMFNYAGNLN